MHFYAIIKVSNLSVREISYLGQTKRAENLYACQSVREDGFQVGRYRSDAHVVGPTWEKGVAARTVLSVWSYRKLFRKLEAASAFQLLVREKNRELLVSVWETSNDGVKRATSKGSAGWYKSLKHQATSNALHVGERASPHNT